jgi:hypothetical protein
LARAFDVVLNVRFESFGQRLVDIENFGRAALEVPSFDSDPVFHPKPIDEFLAKLTAPAMLSGFAGQQSIASQSILQESRAQSSAVEPALAA